MCEKKIKLDEWYCDNCKIVKNYLTKTHTEAALGLISNEDLRSGLREIYKGDI